MGPIVKFVSPIKDAFFKIKRNLGKFFSWEKDHTRAVRGGLVKDHTFQRFFWILPLAACTLCSSLMQKTPYKAYPGYRCRAVGWIPNPCIIFDAFRSGGYMCHNFLERQEIDQLQYTWVILGATCSRPSPDLVFHGKLLSTLEDVGMLGFASNLCSEMLQKWTWIAIY